MFGRVSMFRKKRRYFRQRSKLLRGISYIGVVLSLLITVRRQVTEIEVLQLVPGVYFFISVLLFLFVFTFSFFFYQQAIQFDIEKSLGLKTTLRPTARALLKSKYMVFFTGGAIVLNTVVPLSLDYFSNSSETTLSALWSLGEVLFFELSFLVVLTVLTQTPLLFLRSLTSPLLLQSFPRFWKVTCFFSILGAGIITPTIDGATQLSCAFAFFSLYFFISNLLQRRVSIKANFCLGFHE